MSRAIGAGGGANELLKLKGTPASKSPFAAAAGKNVRKARAATERGRPSAPVQAAEHEQAHFPRSSSPNGRKKDSSAPAKQPHQSTSSSPKIVKNLISLKNITPAARRAAALEVIDVEYGARLFVMSREHP